MPLPRTPDELHELAFNSYFADVAQHLVRTGIPGLMGDPIMEAIADRAVVEADSGDISSRTVPGRGTLRIEWPKTDFVTAAEICLFVGGVQQSVEIVKRAPSDISMEREIRAQSGGSVTAHVRFGITTLQGDVILQHSTSLQTDVIIPAIPVPVATTSKRSGSVPMIDLVDPIEEARLAEIARLAHRKKIRNRILMGVAAIPLLILGGYLYNRFTDDTEKVVLETGYLKNQIDAAKAAGDLLRGTETGYLKNQIDAAKSAGDAQSPATTTTPATTTLPATVTTTVAPTKTSAP
jgi:hypothetical protein